MKSLGVTSVQIKPLQYSFHMVLLYIKLMKALTFEHVDGIQGFAGPFKRILFLPVMLSRFKKRNLFTSIEFT